MEFYGLSSRNNFTIAIIFILALTNLQASLCRQSKEFKICSQTFNCGNLTGITYPFYGQDRPDYCGHPGFELLECAQSQLPKLMIKSQKFLVIGINSTSSTITIAREDYYQRAGCPSSSNIANITIDFTRFQYTTVNQNITLLYSSCGSVCTSAPLKAMTFPCPVTATQNFEVCYLTKKMMSDHNISESTCPNRLFLPVHRSDNMAIDNSGQVMQVSFAAWHGFELKWSADNALCAQCLASGGQCGHDWISNKFFCFCTDESKCPFTGSISDKRHILSKSKIAMLACLSALGTGMLILAAAFCLKRRHLSNNHDTDSQTGIRLDVEAFLQSYGSPGLRRYSYADLKKLTNSFKDKLGEGGNGAVYKGKLHNGHLVAVKILKKLKADAEEFINEVASIGRTNHINVVTLLGFCYDGQKQALLYDFMPNGSLEKFVYGRVNHQSLAWEKLFEIAVGIARGLEYLHRGCNTRILHFDIKPHNILLDENFCPKISDFGLAKLCPQKDSIVSMSEARGTVGYIAPEVFLRSFGGVSYKSDVYSYGMLVLEMVGCRRNAEVDQAEHSGEQYFPDWIYRQLEREEYEGNYKEMLNDKERELQRKMIMVSLWCVQTNPSSRPAMSKVVEMLEGNLESLQIPPTPFSSSCSRSQSHSSTTRSLT